MNTYGCNANGRRLITSWKYEKRPAAEENCCLSVNCVELGEIGKKLTYGLQRTSRKRVIVWCMPLLREGAKLVTQNQWPQFTCVEGCV